MIKEKLKKPFYSFLFSKRVLSFTLILLMVVLVSSWSKSFVLCPMSTALNGCTILFVFIFIFSSFWPYLISGCDRNWVQVRNGWLGLHNCFLIKENINYYYSWMGLLIVFLEGEYEYKRKTTTNGVNLSCSLFYYVNSQNFNLNISLLFFVNPNIWVRVLQRITKLSSTI